MLEINISNHKLLKLVSEIPLNNIIIDDLLTILTKLICHKTTVVTRQHTSKINCAHQ